MFIALAIALMAPAPALGAHVEAVHIDKQLWISKPTARDFLAVYPKDARREKIAGEVSLMCSVRVDGGLTDCAVLEESPNAVGFGDAALALTEKFRLRTHLPDGRPTAGGRLRIPMRFSPR
jgi:protein TonB